MAEYATIIDVIIGAIIALGLAVISIVIWVCYTMREYYAGYVANKNESNAKYDQLLEYAKDQSEINNKFMELTERNSKIDDAILALVNSALGEDDPEPEILAEETMLLTICDEQGAETFSINLTPDGAETIKDLLTETYVTEAAEEPEGKDVIAATAEMFRNRE